MVNQNQNNNGDRRKANLDRRKDAQDQVDTKLAELNARRDIGLAEKLAAIEKLFHAIMSTKSDAISIAVSRIQVDNKDCLSRCANQVSTFYTLIHDLREKTIVQDLSISVIKSSIDELEADDSDLDKEHKEVTDKLEVRIKTVEDWKSNFWTIQIPALIVLTVTTIAAIFGSAGWVLDYLKKLHGGD